MLRLKTAPFQQSNQLFANFLKAAPNKNKKKKKTQPLAGDS